MIKRKEIKELVNSHNFKARMLEISNCFICFDFSKMIYKYERQDEVLFFDTNKQSQLITTIFKMQ